VAVKPSPFDKFIAEKVEPKPYLDKFNRPEHVEDTKEYFSLMNNRNQSVILVKKNYFPLRNRQADIKPLIGRIVIFSKIELSETTMTPEVSPQRVGILQAEGSIKLRHDFQPTDSEPEDLPCTLKDYVELWVRKEGIDSEVMEKFTKGPEPAAATEEKKVVEQPKPSNKQPLKRQMDYYFSDKNY
jgi:hypothetical protein